MKISQNMFVLFSVYYIYMIHTLIEGNSNTEYIFHYSNASKIITTIPIGKKMERVALSEQSIDSSVPNTLK
jgi:hypothetical protein